MNRKRMRDTTMTPAAETAALEWIPSRGRAGRFERGTDCGGGDPAEIFTYDLPLNTSTLR